MPPLILVVDDEPVVRRLAATLLARAGYATLEAGDGQQALRELEARAGDIALVVSDIKMPNMDGLELALAVRKKFPAVPTVLMSAFSYDPVPVSKARFFIPKPFTNSTLLSMVELALSRTGRAEASVRAARPRSDLRIGHPSPTALPRFQARYRRARRAREKSLGEFGAVFDDFAEGWRESYQIWADIKALAAPVCRAAGTGAMDLE